MTRMKFINVCSADAALFFSLPNALSSLAPSLLLLLLPCFSNVCALLLVSSNSRCGEGWSRFIDHRAKTGHAPQMGTYVLTPASTSLNYYHWSATQDLSLTRNSPWARVNKAMKSQQRVCTGLAIRNIKLPNRIASYHSYEIEIESTTLYRKRNVNERASA